MNLKPYQDLTSAEKTWILNLMTPRNTLLPLPYDEEVEAFYINFCVACEVLEGE